MTHESLVNVMGTQKYHTALNGGESLRVHLVVTVLEKKEKTDMKFLAMIIGALLVGSANTNDPVQAPAEQSEQLTTSFETYP